MLVIAFHIKCGNCFTLDQRYCRFSGVKMKAFAFLVKVPSGSIHTSLKRISSTFSVPILNSYFLEIPEETISISYLFKANIQSVVLNLHINLLAYIALLYCIILLLNNSPAPTTKDLAVVQVNPSSLLNCNKIVPIVA